MSRRTERRYTSARERAEKQNTSTGAPYLRLPKGAQIFTPKAGVLLLDILPFEAGEGNPWADQGALHWERTFYVHRGVGANSDSHLCPRMTSKSKCPICEHRAQLMRQNDGDEETENLVKELSPKQRQLFNVINLKDPDKGVQLWDISYHLFGKVLDARLRNADEDDGWDRFFFLEDGWTLKIGMAEKSFAGYTYLEAETIDFRPRKRSYDEDILEQVHCLDEILVETEYDDLKKIYLETKDEDEDDEEEDRPKSKHGSSSKASSAKRPSKDELEDEPEDQPEDEDEDEPPAKKKSSKPVEEDEDEDEPPAKKKSSKPAPKDEDDWDDFDDKPKSSKGKPTPAEDEDEDEPPVKKKPSKPVEEDEDDWDDEDEKPKVKAGAPAEDEDEDEPPAKKKSSKPAPKDEDDEWGDITEDEDEEEEKPKSKPGKGKR